MGLPQTPGKIQLVNNPDVILEQSIKEIVNKMLNKKVKQEKEKLQREQ